MYNLIFTYKSFDNKCECLTTIWQIARWKNIDLKNVSKIADFKLSH